LSLCNVLFFSCSTLVGDIAEVKAVRKVFKDTSKIKMNATKSMVGHCLGAAAGIEAVAVLKAIETGWVHPTLNQEDLIDEVAGIDTVPNVKKQHQITAGISNSFGFGGHSHAA
jgi:3-oxoacyl-[acyl-carrier-protein] synthase II